MNSPPTGAAGSVSILVRSMARPTLYRTLASLALQQGEDIEIVVVDATGGGQPALDGRCGPHPLGLVQPGRPLPRAEAANLALAQTRGRWVLFVDDDDAIDPQHVARLREALLADPGAAAAYAGVRLLGPDGAPRGTLDEPFDLVRLHCENYLPIHAVVFSREAAGPARWFDESLTVHEDWDFRLRLAQGPRSAGSITSSAPTSPARGAAACRSDASAVRPWSTP